MSILVGLIGVVAFLVFYQRGPIPFLMSAAACLGLVIIGALDMLLPRIIPEIFRLSPDAGVRMASSMWIWSFIADLGRAIAFLMLIASQLILAGAFVAPQVPMHPQTPVYPGGPGPIRGRRPPGF